MAEVKLTRFGGIAPRFAEELLPEGYAQEAQNLRLTSGELVPYRGAEFLLNTTVVNPVTIHPLIINDILYWCEWVTDVDFVRSPVAAVTASEQQWLYTGDGKPKKTSLNRATFYTVSVKTATYNVVAGDYENTIQFTTGGVNCNLLAAATAGNQFALVVDNAAASGNVTIDPNAAELINGAATYTLTPGNKVLLKCSGTAWTATVVTTYPYDWFELGVPEPSTAPTIAYDSLAKATTYTVVVGDDRKTIDCSSTPWTLTMGDAATLGASFLIVVRNLGTGTLTVNTTGGQLINGAASITIGSGESDIIVCNGTSFAAVSLTGIFKGYVYTYVTEWGEEGVPSPSSDLLLHISGQRINISGLPATPPAGDTNVKKYRLYRLNSGDTGTLYQFVVEQDIGVTTYADTISDTALGEELISETFDPPPDDLTGVITMANGMCVGFRGNQLCFSEPYQPHAWPLEYRLSVEYAIVALGSIGSSLVVTTEGRPYFATGNHPASVSLYPIDLPYPCLSKRGLVNMGTGILYPSFEGLVFVSSVDPKLSSAEVFTREEWRELNPTTILAQFFDGRYFANYVDESGAFNSFIFSPSKEGLPLLTKSNVWASAAYSDPETGDYYFVQNNKIYLWDAVDSTNVIFSWKSKTFKFDKPVNFGAAQINADFTAPDYTNQNIAIAAANAAAIAAGNVLGYLGDTEFGADVPVAGDTLQSLLSSSADDQVLFQVFVDKALKFSRYVGSNRVFRLPTGFKSDTWSFRVSAKFAVQSILVAETPKGLERVSGK